MDRADITTYLRQVPDLIDEALQGLSDDELRRQPSGPFQVLLCGSVFGRPSLGH